MTKRELLMAVISGLKTAQEDIEFMLRRMKKSTLEEWYNLYEDIKKNPQILKKGKTIRDWQITVRWMMMRS